MRPYNQTVSAGGAATSLTTTDTKLLRADHLLSKASKLWKMAVRGSSAAQLMLGMAQIRGNGVPQNYREGVKWLRRAANRGNISAQLNLGVAYAVGKGVPSDALMAHMWFSLAAMEGDRRAIAYRDRLRRRMSKEEIGVAQRMALEWEPAV